jgi:hypothetical protein
MATDWKQLLATVAQEALAGAAERVSQVGGRVIEHAVDTGLEEVSSFLEEGQRRLAEAQGRVAAARGRIPKRDGR